MDSFTEDTPSLSGQEGPGSTQCPTGADLLDKSGRRKACNSCKQHKLRCDLASTNCPPGNACARCIRFGLECKVDSAFKRTRKRRRSFELEKEIRRLRQQLEGRQGPTPPTAFDWAFPRDPMSTGVDTSGHIPTLPDVGAVQNATASSSRAALPPTLPDAPPPLITASSPDASQNVIGVTTRPIEGPDIAARPALGSIPRARALGNTALSVEEIDELFAIYFARYHPFLPVLDAGSSPHEVYETSELLFWAIISVASRRLRSRPTLLHKLARSVTDLLWRDLRSIPYSIRTVQSLVLLCAWPFPTSSSTSDPTFMLAGMMLQLGTQMGLHRALDVQDFVKTPLTLDEDEYAEWIRTWDACNIVAQSVSVGCGLPLMMQIHDWSLTVDPRIGRTTPASVTLRVHLRIERFRHRVSQALAPQATSQSRLDTSRERIPIYRLLNASLVELEREVTDFSPITTWCLSAARLHLHCFYLLDDSLTVGYGDRIIQLYQTAYSLLEYSLHLDHGDVGFLDYCPFFSYQSFVCAAFVVLKVLLNGFFRTLLNEEVGMRVLDGAIVALRKISVVNNDLPARLGDVIGFFCALPDRTVLSGADLQSLRLKQVKNRLSMSIVYDSLWIWRRQFMAADEPENTETDEAGEVDPAILGMDELQSALGFGQQTGLGGFLDLDWSTT